MADDLSIDSLVLIGSEQLQVDIREGLLSARLSRTLDGVSTLTLEVHDAERTLIRSNIVNSRVSATIDGRSFEMASIGKSEDTVRLTMEDTLVAEMRRHTEPRRFAAGKVTRVQAARALLDEIPWAKMAVGGSKADLTKVELTRGNFTAIPGTTTASPTTGSVDPNYFNGGGLSTSPSEASRQRPQEVTDKNREDTWTAIKRWFSEINWRCYVDAGVLNVGPDSAYIAGSPVYDVREFSDGIGYVDFDWDINQPLAEATFEAQINRWFSPPGTCVQLFDLGPANGKWIVATVDRDLMGPNSDIKLHFPEPELPEPEAPAVNSAGAAQDDYFGGSILGDLSSLLGVTGTGAAATPSTSVYGWPVNGNRTITSGFGPRRAPTAGASSNHKGIDISAAEGQGIFASRDGVVIVAGGNDPGGYGSYVDIGHTGAGPGAKMDATTRYAHMSRVATKRGLFVKRGELIGFVGHTGAATAPHLHFELHRNGTPVDPLPLLISGQG